VARFKPKILLVDDDEHIVRSLEVYLKMEQFEVITASRGEEALQKVEDLTPDIILLDVMMPGMDGFEVLRKLRESSKTVQLPVIMLTAKGQDMDILTGYQLGAASYMTKPFNLTELVDNINMFFEGRTAGEEEEEEDAGGTAGEEVKTEGEEDEGSAPKET
jgi:DNA-binding response OmpR family regulator